VYGLTKGEAIPTTSSSSRHIEAGSQIVGLDSPTASPCRVDASSSANGNSSSVGMEEDTDDDLLYYEPSPVRDGMEISVIYLSSTNYSLLEEEEVSQLALGPQDIVFKKPAESRDHLKLL
jgi:hypothetical protein